MKTFQLYVILCFISLNSFCQTPIANSSNSSIALFNGKNLDGWYQVIEKNGMEQRLFKAENGVIHAYATQTENTLQPFGAIITEKEYENYTLTLEYKWGEKKFRPRENAVRDAGIIFHEHGEDVIWPAGIECQIQEGDTGDLWIVKSRASSTIDPMHKNFNKDGLLGTFGTLESQYNRLPRSFCWEKAGWNKVVLVVKGDFAQFYINDQLVNEAIAMKKWDENQKKWIPLTKGKILLQAEGSEVFYRNITLQPLVKE